MTTTSAQPAIPEPLIGRADSPPGLEPPSILILTKNEELNIAACLDSVSFSDDIVVLDSGSTDRTVEIAQRFPNVRVVHRPFDTEFRQRNFGLHEIPFKHAWVYISDADERVPSELRDEILAVTSRRDDPHGAYRLRYKNMFQGRWIKRSSGYPVWIIRLVRPCKVRYEVRATNVHPIVDGTVGELDHHFVHYSFNSGLKRWFEKHNFYSDKEAEEAVNVRAGGRPTRRELTARDPMARRRAIKNLSFFLRVRGLWRFLYMYILRLGFLDGPAGFHYAAMISMYEYWIELKIAERERAWRDATEAVVHRRLASGGEGR